MKENSVPLADQEDIRVLSARHPQDPSGQLSQLFMEIDELSDFHDLQDFVERLLQIYDLKSVAYLGTGIAEAPGSAPILAVTYTQEWVRHYKAERFLQLDPAIQVGLRRTLPIDWAEFDRRDQSVRRLFGEATEFGLGRQGISIPVHGFSGDRALLSITSDASDLQWQRLLSGYMRDLQLLALHLHDAILRFEGQPVPQLATLAPRERECLLWISEGKTYWETAMILGLSEHTVRCYLASARHKLGAANNTHAVSKAGKARLLSNLP